MSRLIHPGVKYWLFIGSEAQLAYASTLDGYVADARTPQARIKIHAGFATRKQAMAALARLNKRFPAMTKMLNPEPLILTPEQMDALDFDESKRKAFWKGTRGIRMAAKPWDVYLRIMGDHEGFSHPASYHPKVKPGAYGPLPMPWKPEYEAGEVSEWLRDRGYLINDYQGSHVISVSRNTAFALMFRFRLPS